jgi:hypothetical protein
MIPKSIKYVMLSLVVFVLSVAAIIYYFYTMIHVQYMTTIIIGAIISLLSIVALSLSIISNIITIKKNSL